MAMRRELVACVRADGWCPRRAVEDAQRSADLNSRAPRILDVKLVSRLEFGSGAVAMPYEPKR
jgi:hypothetical protein